MICFDQNIYVPLTLCPSVLDWYHLYLNHLVGSRLENTTWKVCNWKVLVTQAELSINMCKKFQQFKKRRTLYGHLLPKIIAALKLWNLVHIFLIAPYSKSIRNNHPDGVITKNYMRLNCMTMIDSATGWFEFFKFLSVTSMR